MNQDVRALIAKAREPERNLRAAPQTLLSLADAAEQLLAREEAYHRDFKRHLREATKDLRAERDALLAREERLHEALDYALDVIFTYATEPSPNWKRKIDHVKQVRRDSWHGGATFARREELPVGEHVFVSGDHRITVKVARSPLLSGLLHKDESNES